MVNAMQTGNLGKLTELAQDIVAVSKKLSYRRKYQLVSLFILQIVGAASEVISIGAILPFLSALANADELLVSPMLQPWLAMLGVDTASHLITLMAIIFAVSIALVNSLRVLILWVQSRLSAAIGSDFSTEIFRRMLLQSYEFHTQSNSGRIISIITNDLGSLMGVFRKFLMMIMQGLIVLAILAGLLAYNMQVACTMAVVLFGAYVIFVNISRNLLLKNGKISSDNHISAIKILQEGLGGIRDTILDGSQDTFTSIYGRVDRSMRRARANSTVLISIPRFLLEVVGISILCGFAVILVWSDKNIQEILPLIGIFSMAAIRLLPAMQRVYNSYAGMQGAHISMKRALEALERPINLTCMDNNQSTLYLHKNIILEDVWFSYSGSTSDEELKEWVLRGINMTIAANTTVALVGDTGSGKSTIADIILGLLSPQRGNIRVDGKVITDDCLYNWRQSIAHVPQTIFLSDNSIKENIAFGIREKDIDLLRVKKMAKLACIDEFIESSPLGYDEIVGERGIRLSGGQRQRIGIARALYKNASTIIFDEATSSLDNTTEAEVMDAINNLSGKITMILIAHRLTTIRSADMVYEIRKGDLVGAGSYDELIKSSDSFRDMVELI